MAAAPAPSEPLTGPQKAAVLCMALGKEQGAKIMQLLTPPEIEAIGREIAALRTVRSAVIENVLAEYQSAARTVQSETQGGVEYAKELIEAAIGTERAAGTLARIRERLVPTPIGRLNSTPPETVVGILRGEHPQAVALVLARLDPTHAAAVIERMDQTLAADVTFRMARMDKVSPDMVTAIEAGLGSKVDLTSTSDLLPSGGPNVVAKMLNCTSPAVEESLLSGISQRDADLAGTIRDLMFVFEDLTLFDGRAMQRLLREVDTKELALALKVASDGLKQHIFKNMSERAGAAVQEEIELLGAVKVKDVEAAHQRVVQTVRTLQEAGEIPVVRRGATDAVV
jgi:flagellar motor switch protein FliG